MKTILAFGDSNTWGLIPGSNPHRRFAWDQRWTGILSQEVPGLRVIEEGLCGRTTVFEDALRPGRRGLSSLPGILESQHPLDGAILMLGTNDCKTIYGVSEHTIGKGVELCLDVLEKYVEPSQILLISPLHLGDDVWLPTKDPEFDKHSVEVSKGLKDVYEQIASRHGTLFLAASDVARASEADDEHLDEDGHRRLAAAIIGELSRLYD